MTSTTTLDFDYGRVSLRFARTTWPPALRRVPLRAGLTGVMPLAKGLKVLVRVIVAGGDVVYLVSQLGAYMAA